MNTKRDARVELRREQAMALRVKGWSYRQIGEATGVSHTQAFLDVKHCLKEVRESRREDAEQSLDLDLMRLDAAIKVCLDTITDPKWENADDPERGRELRLKAIDRLAKLNDQRAKMLGLYAPTEVKNSFEGEVSPQQIRDSVKARFGGNVAPVIDGEGDAASDSTDG